MLMKVTSKSGAALAAAAATLFLAGASLSTVAYAADEGHCVGANACKGQGFSAMTKDKCMAAKGKFEPA
jgi:hypothetical protein